MAQIDCAYCDFVSLALGEVRTHLSDVHARVVCQSGVCYRSFGDARSLREHVESDHLGFRYGCSVCGAGPWKRRSAGSSHRGAMAGCYNGSTLLCDPDQGILYNGHLYEGPIVGPLIRWLAEHRGVQLTPVMAAMTDDQLRRCSVLQRAGLPPVQPQVAPLVQPLQPVAVAPRLMPLGIICGQCMPDAVTLRYPTFASSLALVEHIAQVHPDPGGMILVNWGPEDDSE